MSREQVRLYFKIYKQSFRPLVQPAKRFLERYETADQATQGAAAQAVGLTLTRDGSDGLAIADGMKRAGIGIATAILIFGTLLMLTPTIAANVTGTQAMTAHTTATVVELNVLAYKRSRPYVCRVQAKYSVNGTEYQRPPSPAGWSDRCSFKVGQTLDIRYDPRAPGAWDAVSWELGIMGVMATVVGAIAAVQGVILLVVFARHIVFGLRLLKVGRQKTVHLPNDEAAKARVDEIQKEFMLFLFDAWGIKNGPPRPGNSVNGD